MATNTGLFRIPEGASKPERLVGQLDTPDGSGEVSEALVVRFVGPDTLIGSGHPASGSSLPQALGLIRSEDAGKTWTSVSELGTADFHALEPAGDDIVGALFQQPQVLASGDEGKNWETLAAPLPLVALEVDPAGSAALDRQHRPRDLRVGGRRPDVAPARPDAQLALRVGRGRDALPGRPGRAGQGQHRRRPEVGGPRLHRRRAAGDDRRRGRQALRGADRRHAEGLRRRRRDLHRPDSRAARSGPPRARPPRPRRAGGRRCRARGPRSPGPRGRRRRSGPAPRGCASRRP